MAMQILRDLKGLNVLVVHPADAEGRSLTEHLRRIGCRVEAQWPVPDRIPSHCDIVMLVVEQESRDLVLRFARSYDGVPPTLIAMVDYENPSTLQMVLEIGALAVVERPVRPFGLLTNLTIARSLWLERAEHGKRLAKVERKLAGVQKIQKAKSILMERQGLSEEEAYQTIRKQAMSKRVPMDEMALAIINAHDLLNPQNLLNFGPKRG
ncbi:ANTAR domain-containing response regulator [Microbaculum marinum]|uniref:ANTAR domain-containing protein n=1 Tax=Microbaculum marinum TaxID=1764581 RepID=A0AAW9RIJ9_9HYPH